MPWCNLSPAELHMGRRMRPHAVPQPTKQLIPKWDYLAEFERSNKAFREKLPRHPKLATERLDPARNIIRQTCQQTGQVTGSTPHFSSFSAFGLYNKEGISQAFVSLVTLVVRRCPGQVRAQFVQSWQHCVFSHQVDWICIVPRRQVGVVMLDTRV